MKRWASFSTRSETKALKFGLTICALEGLPAEENGHTVRVQIEWRFRKKHNLLRRTVERTYTSNQCINSAGSAIWNELFELYCKLKLKDHKSSTSWRINLEVHGSGVEPNSKDSLLAKLTINAGDFSGLTENSESVLEFSLTCYIGGSTFEARLMVKLNCREVQTHNTNSLGHPLSPIQLLPSLSSCVSFQPQTRSKIDGSNSESEEDNGVAEPTYGSLITTNQQIGELLDDNEGIVHEDYKNWDSERPPDYWDPQKHSLMRLLSWDTKRLRHRAPDHPRGVPLLNKAYGEDGGDDIDNSRRRQLSLEQPRKDELKYEFSDRFEIGKWERRKLRSRDKNLELVTEIFLASIDQRSEKASGGGACTVLATVLADWLHQNPENLPLKCQFDKLIRDGSMEWRSLCKEERHKQKFSDQHFDLDTVLQAQVRPLMVVPEKSYVGFFEFENNSNKLELLQGVMSFDSLWNDIQHKELNPGGIYIVSWNDHFFVLKIDKEAIYIIDTLGERLCEGCEKAYILKFSRESVIYRVKQPELSDSNVELGGGDEKKSYRELLCNGKSCCKEFIKGFLAALPLRELQCSIERGQTGEAPLHQLLQIEFQYTIQLDKNSPRHGN